jgi:hypothetical protein
LQLKLEASHGLYCSKNVGIISKLRHFIPNHTLLDIYRSFILPIFHMDWLHGEMLPRFTLRNFLYYKNTLYVRYILNHLIITQFPYLFLQILFLLIWCISKNLLTCYTIYQQETRQQLYKNYSKKPIYGS